MSKFYAHAYCAQHSLLKLTNVDTTRDSVSIQPKRDPWRHNQQYTWHVIIHYVVADLATETKRHHKSTVTADWNVKINKAAEIFQN